MLYEHTLIIDLLSAAIYNCKEITITADSIDWDFLYSEVKKHHIESLIYSTLPLISPSQGPNNDLLHRWKEDALTSAATQIKHLDQLRSLITEVNIHKYPLIALKGLILRNYYPHPEFRSMGDADLLVPEEYHERVEQVLLKHHYIKINTSPKHDIYFKEGVPYIELHNTLVENHILEKTQRFHQQVWDNTIESYLADIPILGLSDSNQIIHLTLHMASHFMSGGFGLRQLCDFTLYASNHIDQIDWETLRSQMIDYDLFSFFKALYGICHLYLHLPIPEALKDFIDLEDHNLPLFMEDIWDGGVFGKSSDIRLASSKILHYVEHGEKADNRIPGLFQFIFPRAQKLRSRYAYAQKSPLLLPIAWFHRIFHNMKRKDLWLIFHYALKGQRQHIFNQRSTLLSWLDLK